MKKIVNLFPVVTLEAIIDDYESINTRLMSEIEKLFDNDEEKRVLSHKWNSFVIKRDKDPLGYTSYNGSNLIEHPDFKFFYDHIGGLITDFFAQLDYHEEWNFYNSWASVYPKGAFVPSHDHRPFHWSGAYYVKALDNCGDIRFTDPKEYALQNEPTNTSFRGNLQQSVTPTPGKLLVFPSYLKHETMPNESAEDRIIISFNILAKPTVHT